MTQQPQPEAWHAGALVVAAYIPAAFIKEALPPEYRILGVQHQPEQRQTRYLIEGPALPLATVASVPDVTIVLTLYDLDAEGIQLAGAWDFDRETRWPIKRFADLGAMAAWRTALNTPGDTQADT